MEKEKYEADLLVFPRGRAACHGHALKTPWPCAAAENSILDLSVANRSARGRVRGVCWLAVLLPVRGAVSTSRDILDRLTVRREGISPSCLFNYLIADVDFHIDIYFKVLFFIQVY